MTDLTLLILLTALALLAAVLRIQLAEKQKQPLTPIWRIQAFILPALLLLALVLYGLGAADIVLPAVILGLAEELLCLAIRRRNRKK